MIALREAMRIQIWREVGAASMRDYVERVLGHGPRAANERLRVAGLLDAMPVLDQALAAGDLPYSAVREISRVATSGTEEDWVDACRGKNLRQIEELVAQKAEGDLPDSPPRPELQKFVVRLELTAAEYAVWRQARQQVHEEYGATMEEHHVFAAICRQALEAAPAAQALTTSAERRATSGDATAGERAGADANAIDVARAATARAKAIDQRRGRAKYQIAITICKLCKQGWQHGGGRAIAIEPCDVARAECDAQRIGSLDAAPTRASQEIAPRVRRLVLRRDGDRCTVPGCRAARFIEVHHIRQRANGGDHSPGNLTSLCGGHHDALHRGTLRITGSAPDLTFELRELRTQDVRAHVDSMGRGEVPT